MKLRVLAKPGSRTEDVTRRSDGVFIVRVRARAVDGKANESIRRVLAKEYGCRRTDVIILSGTTSRHKTVEVSQ